MRNFIILTASAALFGYILHTSYPVPDPANGDDHYANWELASRAMKAEWLEDYYPPERDTSRVPVPPPIPDRKIGYPADQRAELNMFIAGFMED